MERVNEFLSHIKERLSSPFFFSFIISWLFCNWQIVVALLWYDPPKTSAGHLGLIDYIDNQTTNLNSIFLPFIFACTYTFLWPIINNGITAFHTWNSKWGEELNLKIVKGGKVSLDKYMSLRADLRKRSDDLQKIIDDESITLTQLSQAHNDLRHLRSEQTKSMSELNEVNKILNSYNNVALIEGKWIRSINGEPKQNIRILSGIVYEASSGQQLYRIDNFNFDVRGERLSFVLMHHESLKPKYEYDFFSFSNLQYQHNEMTGREYRARRLFNVVYRRPSDLPEPETDV